MEDRGQYMCQVKKIDQNLLEFLVERSQKFKDYFFMFSPGEH